MDTGSSLIIVSAFGRGHWLAAELAKEGLPVTLLDVTAQLGVWPPEDQEGPFGFFRNDKISESQIERLYSDDAFDENANGFTLWLKNGPLECKGPMTSFSLEKNGLSGLVKEALAGDLQSTKKAQQLNFKQNWLLQFAHQWASTTFMPNALGVKAANPLPLFSSFFNRQSTRNGLEKSLAWLKNKGVQVIKPQAIRDCSFSSHSMISGLEMAAETQGIFKLERLIWTLSSEETYFLNEKLGKYFYPSGIVESEWSWVRYRVQLQACSEREQLPKHTLLIDDVESPWTHENMLVVQRTSLADHFDVWMRIPTVQRFNKEYLKERSERMQEKLLLKMGKSQPEVNSFPQEYYYNYADLGPSRYPVYKNPPAERVKKSSYKNFHLSGPEVWGQYSWGEYFENDQNTLASVLKWWKDKLLKEQKERKETLS